MTCLDRNSHGLNVCIFIIRTVCIFSNFVALCTDDTDTPVSCDKGFRNFWRVCSNLFPNLIYCFFCKNITSTVDFSILYRACFFEYSSLSPNCTGIRHRFSWKLVSKFASCFRTRLSAFHLRIVNIHTFTQ